MINIAIMGFGVVGSGVAETIMMNSDSFANRIGGKKVNVKYILDLREFPDHPLGDRVVHDINTILEDKEISVVVETMGGVNPAYGFSKSVIESGKSVVTSNKEVVAAHGAELIELAKSKGVAYMFEASVGGGIPIIRPLWQCLAANRIISVSGILNGTCNYILTKMEQSGMDFDTALKQAQKLGYAERDPSADIEGKDTCRKISILSSLAYGKTVPCEKVSCEGIKDISYKDLVYARENGFAVKLLGRARRSAQGHVLVITAPFFVPNDNALSGVNDVYNGISVVGNVVGDVLFCGRGAGSLPTASAVVADVIDVIQNPHKSMGWADQEADFLDDISSDITCSYIRTNSSIDSIRKAFGSVGITESGNEKMFITPEYIESDLQVVLSILDGKYTRIRLMK